MTGRPVEVRTTGHTRPASHGSTDQGREAAASCRWPRQLGGPIIRTDRPSDADVEMTVNLTRIYTKLGDGGETHLGDMSRVSKLHPRVEAYGTVDELNAEIGVALLQPGLRDGFAIWLRRVQNDLLDVGADLSVPGEPAGGAEDPADGVDRPDDAQPADGAERADAADLPDGVDQTDDAGQPARARLRVGPEYTAWLEQACDEVNAELEPLRSFVIPGGTAAAAHLHVCRTVCRRAERRALAVEDDCNPEVVRYLNRLSDLLFILSRAANQPEEASMPAESLWDPGAHNPGTDAGGHDPEH